MLQNLLNYKFQITVVLIVNTHYVLRVTQPLYICHAFHCRNVKHLSYNCAALVSLKKMALLLTFPSIWPTF